MDTKCYWLLCFLLTIFIMIIHCEAAAPTIEVEASSNLVREDDPLEVLCKIRTEATKPTIQYVHKPSGEIDIHAKNLLEVGKEVELNSEQWNQIKVSYEKHAEDHHFKINLPGLKTSQSGFYGCRMGDDVEFVFVQVLVPPEEIFMKSSIHMRNMRQHHQSNYVSNTKTKLHLRMNNESLVFCHVVKTYPQPRVRIFFGRSEMTDWFDRFVSLTRNDSKSFYYDLVLSSKHLRITPFHDHNKVSCQVDYPDVVKRIGRGVGEGPNVYEGKVSYTIDLVDYKPIISCLNNEQVVQTRLHDTSFEIKCIISSKPQFINSSISWPRLTVGRERMDAGVQLGNYQVLLLDHENSSETKYFIFRINHIYPQHFRTYNIEATNMEGTSHYEVTIKQIMPPPEYLALKSNAVPTPLNKSSMCLLTFILLLYYVSGFL